MDELILFIPSSNIIIVKIYFYSKKIAILLGMRENDNKKERER